MLYLFILLDLGGVNKPHQVAPQPHTAIDRRLSWHLAMKIPGPVTAHQNRKIPPFPEVWWIRTSMI